MNIEETKQPLVSIIIPTYNRAHLIGETLDSIIAQTYQNWECIIVDDGSSDHTDDVVGEYVKKDARFKFYHRPDEHLPGGNGARNYGFKMSKGEFINWFDSDDLMVPEKIELKVKAMLNNDVDFVVSGWKHYVDKTVKYRPKFKDRNDFNSNDITFLNFALPGNVTWVTNDIFFKREFVKKTNFNEKLKAGQEYNFCCRLLLKEFKCLKLDEQLVLKRYNLYSIGKKRQKDKMLYWETSYDLYWITLNDIDSKNLDIDKFKKYALYNCIRSYFESNFKIKLDYRFHSAILKIYNYKAIYFYLAIISVKVFNKKEYFLNKLKYNL